MARGIDWIAAEAFYLGLDPPRSFGKVARQFGVSDTRVSRVAKERAWRAKANRVDAEASQRAHARIVSSREQRVARVLGIVDGFVARFDDKLDELELKPSDLPPLVKLAELLVGEATDRMSFAEVQEALGVVIDLAVEFLPAESKLAFIVAVRERLGGAGSEAA